MILEGDVDKIAHDLEVSASTVRNVWDETKSGDYPEYAEFLPIVTALRALNEELTKTGTTVAQAHTGLTIFNALTALGVELAKLPRIVDMLKDTAGEKPPPGFGNSVEQLVKLRAETNLDFQQLANLVTTRRTELGEIQAKVKDASGELASVQSKIGEARENLERALKQNEATLKDIAQYRESKHILHSADLSFADVDGLVEFIKTARSGGFLEAAKELAALQKETGLNFNGIRQAYRENRDAVEKSRVEKDKLTTEINDLKIKLADLKKQISEQLAENELTRERLARLNSVIDRLKNGGINLE